MKNIIIFLLIFFSTSLIAQTDSLTVEFSADTVIITDFGANENCCSAFKFNVQLQDDSILYITEIDTGMLCRCGNCNFDLQVKITELPAGDYIAKIYRDWEQLDRPVLFIGEIRFSFKPSITTPVSMNYSFSQGECYHIIDGLEEEGQADEFILYNAYPNPFNPKTNIRYNVRAYGNTLEHVNISIFNVLGQKVATLVNEKQQAGQYKVEWDASRFNSGVYFYRLVTSSGFSQVRKIVLIR